MEQDVLQEGKSGFRQPAYLICPDERPANQLPSWKFLLPLKCGHEPWVRGDRFERLASCLFASSPCDTALSLLKS